MEKIIMEMDKITGKIGYVGTVENPVEIEVIETEFEGGFRLEGETITGEKVVAELSTEAYFEGKFFVAGKVLQVSAPVDEMSHYENPYEKWLKTFIEEKGLDLDSEFTVEHEGNIHFINLGFLVEVILKSSKEEQEKIQNTIVRLDFINGNVMHFFEHLAFAYIVHNY